MNIFFTLYRDEVHQDIDIDPLATKLLNTTHMQRLGRVSQLGYASLVFRGATHSRLSHSVGVYHMAGIFIERLRKAYEYSGGIPTGAVPPEDFLPFGGGGLTQADRWKVLEYLVRWAGLLHDMGHVAFGHTLEDEYESIYEKHDDFASPRIPFLWAVEPTDNFHSSHEILRAFECRQYYPDVFETLFRNGLEPEQIRNIVLTIILHKKKRVSEVKLFQKYLEEAHAFHSENISDSDESELNFGTDTDRSRRQIIDFIEWLQLTYSELRSQGRYFAYMSDIVANTICADFLDYIQRDATNLGLDLIKDHRVVSRFWIGKDQSQDLHMALSLRNRRGKERLDTCTGVVEMVRRRFRFAEVVYYHKTKAAASAMLVKSFSLIGKPPEINYRRKYLDNSSYDLIVDTLLRDKDPQGAYRELIEAYQPSAMLDCEIGDEALMLLLQMNGWDRLREASSSKSKWRSEAPRYLAGIRLIQMINARNLYKAMAFIDFGVIQALLSGEQAIPEVERKITKLIKHLRGGNEESADVVSERRADIELKMGNAAGFENGSAYSNHFILYVPPRKSQAKGIETGAFSSSSGTITLSEHEVVKTEVEMLGDKYSRLWRVIAFVRPDKQNHAGSLSFALHVLIEEIAKILSVEINEVILNSAMSKAANFSVVIERHQERETAKLLERHYDIAIDIPEMRDLNFEASSLDWDLYNESQFRDWLRPCAPGGRRLATLYAQEWIRRRETKSGGRVDRSQVFGKVKETYPDAQELVRKLESMEISEPTRNAIRYKPDSEQGRCFMRVSQIARLLEAED